MKYTEITMDNEVIIRRDNQDGTVSFIPTNPANSDYQRYLRWLAGEPEEGTLGTKSALDEADSK